MAVFSNTQGARIRSARLAAGLTQGQLARAISTSERNIVRWENDQNAPRFSHVEAIATATGKPLSFFTVDRSVSEEAAPSGDQFRDGPGGDADSGSRGGGGKGVSAGADDAEGRKGMKAA